MTETPATPRAVFLSYASQDAGAARRLCETLRAAGVEVWFDVEGGLETGDEWDAKIRRQIKECVLFIPLISANTQAREEGYFRIEWDLAAERARGIASGVAFLLPIVIDDTREADALVPDRFRSVQWTRAAGGELAAATQAKFAKLWSHRAGLAKHKADANAAGSASPAAVAAPSRAEPAPATPAPRRRRLGVFVGGAMALLALGALGWKFWPAARPSAAATPGVVAPPAPDWPRSPELKRAVALLDGLELIPEDFRLAEEIAARELERRPTDPETVTVMARVHSMWLLRGWDRSNARYQKARSAAERALQLAPDEPEAHLALAIFLYARGTDLPRALALAQRAVDLRPNEPRFHRIRDNCLFNQNVPAANVFLDVSEANETPGLRAALESARRTVALFPRDPLVRYELSRHYRDLGRWEDFERVNEETIALYPLANALVWKARARFGLHGDLPGMKAVLDQVPARVRAIERTVFGYFLYAAFTGETAVGRDALNGFTEPWMIDFDFRGPKSQLMAALLELDGRKELARLQYEMALTELKQSRLRNPEDVQTYMNEAWVLRGLGRTDEARAALRMSNEALARPLALSPLSTWWFQAIPANLLLGERAFALTLMREAIASRADGRETLRRRFALDPRLAEFREDAELQALLDEPTVTPAAPSAAPAGLPPSDKSVAVLAFANLSEDKANEYFSDGISEELLNVLAKVPGLKVSARTSAFFFKGKNTPIPEIAKQLGVAYVVEGSVRRAGEKVRITAQLIKAADGFHVWSETFTRDLKDVFAVQDEIAGLIAKNLSLRMGVASSAPALDAEVLPLYYAALQAWNLRTLEGMDRAEALLNDALARAPQFARGHAALAAVWLIRGEITDTVSPFGLRASPLAQKIAAKLEEALQLDPRCAEAYAVRGALGWDTWAWDAGLADLRRATELNPNFASAHQWMGRILACQGRLDEAIASLRRAVEVDPLSPRILDNYGRLFICAGRPREALVQAERALELQPGAVQALGVKAEALALLGQHEAAAEIALRLPTEMPIVSIYKVGVLAKTGPREQLADMLPRMTPGGHISQIAALVALGRVDEAAAAVDPAWFTATRWDMALFSPLFDPLRAHPRWATLLTELGQTEGHARAQAWRAAHPVAKSSP
jgi:TolB-like protein/Flp pilus assembly protein TadD